MCKWKESSCLEMKPSCVSQTCHMANWGKNLPISAWFQKCYKTSCLLKQPFQATLAHDGKMTSELPVLRTKIRAAELGSSSSIQLPQVLLASHRTHKVIPLHYFKVSLYSSSFLRRITTISVTQTPYRCYGIYYGISAAHR